MAEDLKMTEGALLPPPMQFEIGTNGIENDRDLQLNSLAEKIEGKLRSRMSSRAVKESEWNECAALYYGSMGAAWVLPGETPWTNIRNTRSRPGFNIVRTKCDAAIAQCVSMQFGVGEKNWDIWPQANSVDPMDPIRCELMSNEIEAQLDMTRYAFECRTAIEDRIIYGTGIIKGPVNTGKVVSQYEKGYFGEWQPKTAMLYTPMIERVNPWFFFPDDSTNIPNKIQDAIQIHPMSAVELSQYRKHAGYDADAILEALQTRPGEYAVERFTEYANLMNTNPQLFRHKYCVIEYHGPITRSDLEELGIDPTYDSPTDEYYGEVWSVNRRVIRIEMENIEGSFETPYAISPWKRDPASVFGFGHPLTMRDQQRVVTQTWHMILDNSSISSGPQVAIQKRFIQPADGEWDITPRKVWHLTDPMMKVSDAIDFFYPPNVIKDLIPVLQLAREFSEEESATPMIAAGMQSPQAGETATGALVAQHTSTTLLDLLSEQWDDQVTDKVIRRMYAWNMLYGTNEEAKGNFTVDVRSSNEYKNKQMHVRDVERLSMEAAQNPAMAKWINPDALIHIRLSMMNLPSRTIIRSPEEAAEWEQQQAQQAQQSDPNVIKAQIEMQKMELDKMAMEIDMQKAQMENQIAMAKLEMERETNATKNMVAQLEAQAMISEAQAMIASGQLQHEAKMVELNLKAQEMGLKYSTDASKTSLSNQTAVFIEGMNQNNKARELDIFEQELALKRQGKTGI